ncbi:MAG: beta-lactamase family protein [Deltaproteobacteria bacterium]|jgi:CubicO group peptidase (beta-lactamase class C family)|nr:beta-lactamase family protein [Deltaproteobacteria bacterium]
MTKTRSPLPCRRRASLSQDEPGLGAPVVRGPASCLLPEAPYAAPAALPAADPRPRRARAAAFRLLPALFLAAGALALFTATDILAKGASPLRDAGGPAGAGAVQAPEESLGTEAAAALQAILDARTSSGELAGAVFVAMRDGKVVFEGASGQFDREAGIPMTPDALFRLASVSKAFTSLAAAALISQGAMSLDDPVTRFLPYFTPKARNGSEPVITVRQLLTHTSGLGYGFMEKPTGPMHRAGVSDGCTRDEGLTIEENMRRLASVPLRSLPGTEWRYSLSADVMGAAMAAAAGKTYNEVMEEAVSRPLGLSDTGFFARDPSRLTAHYSSAGKKLERMTDPYLYRTGSGRAFSFSPGRALDPAAWPSGGCGMVSSAREVALAVDAARLLGKGGPIGDAGSAWFLADAIAPRQSDPGDGFGGGWAVMRAPVSGPYSPGTIRWSGVYGHQWFADPASGLSGALLTNTAMRGMTTDAMRMLAEELYRAR